MSKQALCVLLDEWLKHKKYSVKTSSFNIYQSIINNNIIPQLGHLLVIDLNEKIFKDYYHQFIETRSNTYITTIFNILVSSLNSYPTKQKMLKKFINENINTKVIKKSYMLLSKNQIEQMIQILIVNKNKYYIGILIAICTGMRIGEICALRFSNIDLEKHLIFVEKTIYRIKDNYKGSTLVMTTPKTIHSQRVLPIHKNIYTELLSLYSHSTDYVLTQSKIPLDPRILRRQFKLFLEKYDFMDMRFHDLRHSFANLCFDQGVDFKSISELLGHANIATTLNLYVHSNIKKKQKYIDELF